MYAESALTDNDDCDGMCSGTYYDAGSRLLCCGYVYMYHVMSGVCAMCSVQKCCS